MRSRKPETRATMSTWRELSVCATKLSTCGMVCGAMATTLTCGGGRSTGRGDRINLGDALGVDQTPTGGWLGAEWRFAPRHRIGLTYTRFTLNGDRSAARDLHIDDKVYPVGASLHTQLRLEIIPITYSYSLVKRPDDELALTAGIHWDRLTFKVGGSVTSVPAPLS